MGKEIEIRFQLLNANNLVTILDETAKRICEKRQIDTYYDHKKNTFIKDVEHIYDWLRIRSEDGIYSINYKHWLPEGEVIRTYCEENELEISSSYEMDKLLKNMGFYVLVVVDKKRTVWKYKNYEIAIDIVKDLGEYIEIEYKGEKNGDINEIHKSLYSILLEISAEVGLEDHGGYGFKLIKKRINENNGKVF